MGKIHQSESQEDYELVPSWQSKKKQSKLNWPEYQKTVPRDNFNKFNEWLGLPEKEGNEIK